MNEISFDWALGEQDLLADPWGADCPGCAEAKRQVKYRGEVAYCTVHRCRGTVRSGHHAGERCRHHVSGTNPLYCDKHGCEAVWTSSDGTWTSGCANEGSMRTLPDGRRVRGCDHHAHEAKAA